MNAPAAQLTAAILAFTAAKSGTKLDADRLPIVPFGPKVPHLPRLELPGGWVAIRFAGQWEIYDHYEDEPGLERFRGYAGQATAEALERALGASLRAA